MNISKDEAICFVNKILGILDLKNLREDRMKFLNELILATHRSVAFQNVTLLSWNEKERRRPTLEEIKSSMMNGLGGLCYTVGVFMVYLLRALDYKTDLVAASIHKYPDNHIVAIVRDLTYPGSKHLVDAWTGWPTFEAFPLDFAEESPIYHHSFLEFKFVKKGDTILRFHRKGHKYDKREMVDEWSMVYEVNLTPREVSYFDHSMSEICTKPGVGTPFLVQYRAVTYSKDMRLVAFKNRDFFLEKKNGELDVRELQSREEMMSLMGKHFPRLATEYVSKAMDAVHLWDNM